MLLLVIWMIELECFFLVGWKVGFRIVLLVEVCERKDLGGKVDWEKGVVGEIKVELLMELVLKVVFREMLVLFCFEGIWWVDEMVMY